MNNTLIDRETLGQFIDELIKKKALAVNNEEELDRLREKSIESLDYKIGIAIFGQLTEDQNIEFNRMIDREEEPSEEEYRNFFKNVGVDLERTISGTMEQFANEFLGGQNA